MNRIKELVKGNKKYRKKHHPSFQDNLVESVIMGQHPKIMFITCSDSRVTHDLILDTKPGDMFILRNVGNFIPPFKEDNDFHGVAAAIEYAVSILEVEEIIVCGHSNCGACQSLYNDIPDSDALVHVKKWLELGEKAKIATLKTIKDPTNKKELYRETEKNSILYQAKNLFSYPSVGEKIERGELRIHRWYYSIEDGSLEYYDLKEKIYKPIEELFK